MKNDRPLAAARRLSLFTLPALLLLLTACGTSRPSRFYLIPSALNAPAGASMDVAQSELHIGFFPVEISSYLDRPQIVSRGEQGDLVVDEFSRWASPLSDAVLGALAGNLALELPNAYVDIFPWTETDDIEYKIMVDVLRMDGVPGRNATLIAQWTVLEKGADHPPLARRTTVYEHKLNDGGVPTYVAGFGKLIEQLSRDIADCLRADIAAGASATPAPADPSAAPQP